MLDANGSGRKRLLIFPQHVSRNYSPTPLSPTITSFLSFVPVLDMTVFPLIKWRVTLLLFLYSVISTISTYSTSENAIPGD
jgi:hypothetical protein